MKEPTKVQVLDALQTHKTVQKAAKALGMSYPKMQHLLKKYGIVCNAKEELDFNAIKFSGTITPKVLRMNMLEHQIKKIMDVFDVSVDDAKKIYAAYLKIKFTDNVPWYKRIFKKGE